MQKQVIGKATLYCGDVLDVLPKLDGGLFDALITDPPYSSGGIHKSDRSMAPSQKYVNATHYSEFSGDNRDQRSWAFWCTQWMAMSTRLVRPGGYFRHQAEYIAWGSNGKLAQCPGGPFPGVITERVNPSEKLHMTAKPVRLMQELVRPLADDARVLDPFMGSGTTALPVLERGGTFTGIELTNQYFDIACARIEKAQALNVQG